MTTEHSINSILDTLRARVSTPLPDFIQASGSVEAGSLEELADVLGATPLNDQLEPLDKYALAEEGGDQGLATPEDVLEEIEEPEELDPEIQKDM